MRVGVLGGSFDPVHNAHLIVAQLARDALCLDRVLLIVAGIQPFKQGQHVASPVDRLRMAELAVQGIPGLVADGRELRRPGPSYTVDTLHELTAELPGTDLVLLLGADVARGFARWREPDAIRRLARVVVYPRGSGDAMVPPGFDDQLVVPALDISSTVIRARAAAGKSCAGWVPERVADYIVASQVYGSQAG